VAPPVDSHAHREATDSNSVWEVQARVWPQQADAQAQRQQTLPMQATPEKWHGAPRQDELREASRWPQLRQAAQEKQAAAPAAWQRPEWAREKFLRAQPAELPQV
jgi:hypothetical protein